MSWYIIRTWNVSWPRGMDTVPRTMVYLALGRSYPASFFSCSHRKVILASFLHLKSGNWIVMTVSSGGGDPSHLPTKAGGRPMWYCSCDFCFGFMLKRQSQDIVFYSLIHWMIVGITGLQLICAGQSLTEKRGNIGLYHWDLGSVCFSNLICIWT